MTFTTCRLNLDSQHLEAACFRVVINSKIADILVDHPQGLHIEELATKSGVELGKLRRILKFLATKHCFREGGIAKLVITMMLINWTVTPDVFANNRLSMKLLSTDPISSLICVV